MKVAIIGRTQLLYDTIEEIEKAGHRVVYIATAKAAPEYTKKEEDFKIIAQERKVLFSDSVAEFKKNIFLAKEYIADVAISVNWPIIIGNECISKFRFGILNAHCGDLPRYRGNACPNWAIINGESKIGISIHYMEADSLDSGDIILKKLYDVNSQTTITDIYKMLDEDVPKMFVEALKVLVLHPEQIEPQSKDVRNSLRCYPRVPSDSMIDWNWGMERISREIRAACKPFMGAYTYYKEKKIYIFDVLIKKFREPCCVMPGQVIAINKENHCVEVACSDGVIILKSIELENGDKVFPEEVLNSMRIRLGYCLQDEIYELKKRIDKLEQTQNN